MLGNAARGLRILLVAMPRAMQNEVEEALQGLEAGHVLYWVSQADLASERAEGLQPEVILVDDGFASVADVIGDLTMASPGSTVIYLTQSTASEAISEAMMAGARSFIPKPVRSESLGRILSQVQARVQAGQGAAERRNQGYTVVFCAPKGGTGRTTLAINTALGLAQANVGTVALMDADYAAPALDVALNLMPERSIVDLLPRLSQMDDSLMQGVLSRHASGVRVLLAPEPTGPQRPISPSEVQQVLALMRRLHDWTLVDLGLPIDETALAFIDGADLVILSVLPEMVGLRNMRLLLDQIALRDLPEERVWVVLNRANMGGGVGVGDIEKHLRTPVRYRIPDDQRLATNAVNRGIPILAAHRRGVLPKAYRGLVAALQRALEEDQEPGTNGDDPKRGGPLSRLSGRG